MANINDLKPFTACCCVITSLYTDMPDCIGLQGKYVLTCLDVEYKCCKVGKDEILCICNNSSVNVIKPSTCIQGSNQCFCFDTRCAFPCNNDVPCLVTLCFLTCFANYNFKLGFYKEVEVLKA